MAVYDMQARRVVAPTGPNVRTIAGRVPPQDLDAEKAVLSAVLSDGYNVLELLGFLKPEHFYSEAHQIIFLACRELWENKTPIDYVTVHSWVRDRELSGRVKLSDLAYLVDATPAVSHCVSHAKTVFEKWRLRKAIANAQRHAAEGYGDVGEEQQWLNENAQAALEIAQGAAALTATVTAGDAAAQVMQDLSAAAERGDQLTGVPSGLASLDAITSGLQPGQMWLVTGRNKLKREAEKTTGVGKSALAINTFALNVAEQGYGVAIFSFEDDRKRIGRRMLATKARLAADKLKSPRSLALDDFSRFTWAAEELRKLPIKIEDRKDTSWIEMRSRAFEMRAELATKGHALKLVIVDNAQLANVMAGFTKQVTEEYALSEYGKRLIALAEELSATVLLLSQLNAEGHVKGCKRLENHARGWLEIRRSSEEEPEPCYLAIRKMTDADDDQKVPLWWHGKYLLFSEEQWV